MLHFLLFLSRGPKAYHFFEPVYNRFFFSVEDLLSYFSVSKRNA